MLGEILFYSSHLPLLVAGACLIVAQLVVMVRTPGKKEGEGSTRMLAWACALPVVASVVIGLLMVIRTQTGKAISLEALGAIGLDEKAVILSKGIAEYKGYWLVGGGLLILIGLLGIFSVWLVRRRLAGIAPASPLPQVALSGLGAAMVLMGTGLILRATSLFKAFYAISYADAAEKSYLMEYASREAPALMPFVLAALGVILVTGIASACLSTRAGEETAGTGRGAVVVSLFVLVSGAILFAATRPHARDAGAIPELFERFPRQGEILFGSPDIVLPELENTQALSLAPVIQASEEQISLGRESMGSPRTIAEDKVYEEIPELYEKLDKLKKNFIQLHPGMKFAGKVILQFDRHVDARAVAKVFQTCYWAGYRKIQVATNGIWSFPSAVLGDYGFYRPRALVFELVHRADEEVPDPERFENFEAWMKKIDRASAQGPVTVPVGGDSS